MQKFNQNDEVEQQFIEAGTPAFDIVDIGKDEFFEEAFQAAPLGDLLWENDLAPLSRAILQTIFRESFSDIIESFIAGGTFESYLTVFRKIFGEGVEVTFDAENLTAGSMLAPGKLNIDIVAEGFEISDFVARSIEDNAYLFEEVIDDEGDNIVFQTIKGFQSQYELEQMLFEMVPGGIFTEITLDI